MLSPYVGKSLSKRPRIRGPHGFPFIDYCSAPVKKGSINDIGMSNHPSDIGGRPKDIPGSIP